MKVLSHVAFPSSSCLPIFRAVLLCFKQLITSLAWTRWKVDQIGEIFGHKIDAIMSFLRDSFINTFHKWWKLLFLMYLNFSFINSCLYRYKAKLNSLKKVHFLSLSLTKLISLKPIPTLYKPESSWKFMLLLMAHDSKQQQFHDVSQKNLLKCLISHQKYFKNLRVLKSH